jgi:Raf kinase inhibitor-like YbhB/YbcL family protein
VWNIPATSKSLPEAVEKKEQLDNGTLQGRNDFKRVGYGGPCPPAGKPHRYFFKLYALYAPLELKSGATKAQLEQAMKGHVIANTELMGTFAR